MKRLPQATSDGVVFTLDAIEEKKGFACPLAMATAGRLNKDIAIAGQISEIYWRTVEEAMTASQTAADD